MTVYCQSDDCRYYKDGECDRRIISLDCDNECEDYESYRDDAGWQKPFWKRMKDQKTNQVFRVLYYGKEVEVNGRKFFVESQSSYALVTDAITGLGACKQGELIKRFEEIIEAVSKLDIPPLESLPIGEYDEKTRRIKPPTEKGGEEE